MFKFEEELKRFEPLPEADAEGAELSGDLSKDLSVLLRMLEKNAEEGRTFDQLELEDVQ